MKINYNGFLSYFLLLYIGFFSQADCKTIDFYPPLNHSQLAKQYYGEDDEWYLENIPFFECSDSQIEQVYYYRWKLYKAHIRNIGTNQYVITEFINHVSWDREPYCTINAASMHHIYEGRWLKNPVYINGYINYLCNEGGNDRRYSESISDAAFASYLVNGNKDFIISQLEGMKYSFDQWIDHYDAAKNLYYIPAMPDATEYTIASIDASGGKDGFDGGDAFRPTINSYMYGNASAIAKIAALAGDAKSSIEYEKRAENIKNDIQQSLWNDELQHFTDRFKVNNSYVKYWDFIRGRELAGFVPWYFNLPDDSPAYNLAWKSIKDSTRLLGPFGFRTNEPSYEYYFKQFVFYEGKPGSQWNGPSWPYQTSQVITAMANFLNNYKQDILTNSDYLKSLRLYARQHFLSDGSLNLVENYDPDKGGPIVNYYWSSHYLHSTFNNLVISGLCGIRPTESDILEINPLIDQSIKYFCLSGFSYRGHDLTILYDKDGTKYKLGNGLSFYVDGKKVELEKIDNKYRVEIKNNASKKQNKFPKQSPNYALNIAKTNFPKVNASINSMPDSINQAVDGKIWYFPEITNYWSTFGSSSASDWMTVNFEKPEDISALKIYPFTDEGKKFVLPENILISVKTKKGWQALKIKKQQPENLIPNTANTFVFEKISAEAVKIDFKHKKGQIAISELECY